MMNANELNDDRVCTCHPDDNPPSPCPRKFALSACIAADRQRRGDDDADAVLSTHLMRANALRYLWLKNPTDGGLWSEIINDYTPEKWDDAIDRAASQPDQPAQEG